MRKFLILIAVLLLAIIIAIVSIAMCGGFGGDKASEGLDYTLSEDGSSYNVSGTGTCDDSNIVIPETHNGLPVKAIGRNAFRGNKTVKKVTISKSVVYIYEGAFKDCTRLTDVSVSAKETYFGDDAFDGTPLYEDKGNWDGDVFYIGKVLVKAKTTISGSYTVREGTTTISQGAFENCTLLTSITIVNSVTTIGQYAFAGCIKLASITLSDSLTYIGVSVFYGTAYYNTESNWTEGALYIGKHLIQVRATVTGSFTVKQGTLTIAGGAFSECVLITSVTIAESVVSIGVSAFSYCIKITSITIPSSVTYIGYGVFVYCSSLTTITVEAGNKYYYSEGNCLIEKSTKTVISGSNTSVIPEGIESIGDGAFAGFAELKSVTIPGSVTHIGVMAFWGCIRITSITIPDGVTFIGIYAFRECVSLTTIVIPDSVISIGTGAFFKCTALVSITISENIIFVGQSAFEECDSLQFNDSENGMYLGNSSNKYLVLVKAKSTEITSCTINVKTKIVCSYAFKGCASLTSITIPEGVTSIGYGVFMNCTSLTTVKISGSVTCISEYAFYGCSKLTSITITKGVTRIGGYAFSGCTSLTTIIIPDSVTSIEVGAFYSCTSLTSITISVSVTYIGEEVFYKCTSLVSITFTGTKAQWDIIIKGANWDEGTGDYKFEFSTDDTTAPTSIYGTYKFAYYTVGGVTVKSGEQGCNENTLILVFNEDGTFTLTAAEPAIIFESGTSISGTWTLSNGKYVLTAEDKILTDAGVIEGGEFKGSFNAGEAVIGFKQVG